MVKCGSKIILYAYEWKFEDQEIASDLVRIARKTVQKLIIIWNNHYIVHPLSA